MIVLGKSPALCGYSVRNQLLEAGLAAWWYAIVLIVEAQFAKITAALQSHSTSEHHHHLRVTRWHVRVAAFTATMLLEG